MRTLFWHLQAASAPHEDDPPQLQSHCSRARCQLQHRLLQLLELTLQRWPHAVRTHADAAMAESVRVLVLIKDPFSSNAFVARRVLRYSDIRAEITQQSRAYLEDEANLEAEELAARADDNEPGTAAATVADNAVAEIQQQRQKLEQNRLQRGKRQALRLRMLKSDFLGVGAPVLSPAATSGSVVSQLMNGLVGAEPTLPSITGGGQTTNAVETALSFELVSSDSVAHLRYATAKLLRDVHARDIDLCAPLGSAGRARVRAAFQLRQRASRSDVLAAGASSSDSSSEDGLDSNDDSDVEKETWGSAKPGLQQSASLPVFNTAVAGGGHSLAAHPALQWRLPRPAESRAHTSAVCSTACAVQFDESAEKASDEDVTPTLLPASFHEEIRRMRPPFALLARYRRDHRKKQQGRHSAPRPPTALQIVAKRRVRPASIIASR